VALTPARHAIVYAELQYIHTYLTSLARELDAAAPLTAKRGLTYQVANQAAEQVAHLRQLLAEPQEKPHSGEKIQEVSTHHTLPQPTRATAQVQTR
jgi:hypothetical protein